ncbi:MAG: 30S ribosomal protein S5 [DPANN group archaeon]|nr:30S ribosomal protein S5 [DPANN group archaeon]
MDPAKDKKDAPQGAPQKRPAKTSKGPEKKPEASTEKDKKVASTASSTAPARNTTSPSARTSPSSATNRPGTYRGSRGSSRNDRNSRGGRNSRKSSRGRRNTRPRDLASEEEHLAAWKPVTGLGKQVKEGKITDIDVILNSGQPILEPEIVDTLLPGMEIELLLVGQSKGKFGGGQRRIFRQTQKKTREGNKPQFLTYAVIGNKNGYVGVGYGKSKETVPAREKAIRRAKLEIIKIRRGTGSWEDNSKEPHSLPFSVTGKCGSSEMTLMPAPKGKGLVIESECAKIVALAGIKNVWSKTRGQTKTKINLLNATFEALKKLSRIKVPHHSMAQLNIVEGKVEAAAAEPEEAVVEVVEQEKA